MSPISSLTENPPNSCTDAEIEVSAHDFQVDMNSLPSSMAYSLESLEPGDKQLPQEFWEAVRHVLIEPQEPLRSKESIERVYDLGFKASVVSPARFQTLKSFAKKVIKEGKIFRLIGPRSVVLQVLRRRGWIRVQEAHHNENVKMALGIDVSYQDAITSLPDMKPNEDIPKFTNRCEDTLLSLMVANEPVKMIWLTKRWQRSPMYDALCNPSVLFNRIGKPYFAPKYKLANSLHKIVWTSRNQAFYSQLPRTYLIDEEMGRQMFLRDYYQTACLGFLKYVAQATKGYGIESLFRSNVWHIPYTTLEFAYNRCLEFLESLKYDGYLQKSHIAHMDWESFIKYHLLLTCNKSKMIQLPVDKDVTIMLEKSKDLLLKIKECWPYYSMEGYRNIWILKPKNSFAGIGVSVTNDLEQIEKTATCNYLVQKYVENPLLIFNTKGDIRQYFLVTRTVPLQVWMYADSYIRLSTQPYTLNDFNQSIHVTNAAVQKKYPVSKNRDSRLPPYSMLSSQTFREYLRKIQKPTEWTQKIYPQMKQTIVGCLLANQDNLVQGPNNFELFGADFILDENCTPWLMEINQNPLLASSNPVTAKLSLAIADDIFKIILDRAQNNEEPTGHFELICNQKVTEIPSHKKCFLSDLSKDDIRRQMYTHLIEVAKRR